MYQRYSVLAEVDIIIMCILHTAIQKHTMENNIVASYKNLKKKKIVVCEICNREAGVAKFFHPVAVKTQAATCGN